MDRKTLTGCSWAIQLTVSFANVLTREEFANYQFISAWLVVLLITSNSLFLNLYILA